MSENNQALPPVYRIESPIECLIVQRINRFVVEVQIDERPYRASTNHTGRLAQFLIKGKKAFCLSHDKPGETDFKLFSIMAGDHAAIIDTQLQMRASERSIEMSYHPQDPYIHVFAPDLNVELL